MIRKLVIPLSLMLFGCVPQQPAPKPLPAAVTPASEQGAAAAPGDDGDPMTHVKRLSDPKTLPEAVKRLIQFYEDAMTQDAKDQKGPNVVALADKIIEPLTKVCIAGNVDEQSNSKIIKLLSDARDPRGEACLIKALKDYKPESSEEDVRWAARALGKMKSQAATGPLLDVFTKLEVAKPKASVIYREVHDAMVALNDPWWEAQLIPLLGRPIADPKDIATLKNEVYWQVTAAKLLGLQKSTRAIEPLLKVVLSPAKADIAMTAVQALVKIGKPVIDPTVRLLNGDAKDLIDYAKAESLKAAGKDPTGGQKKAADMAYLGVAAMILGAIGREDGAAPLIAAMDKADGAAKAVIARELSKLPKTAQTVKAFKAAYDKTPVTMMIPPGMGARETLIEAAPMFFDASLTGWIVETALNARGDEEDVTPVRDASFVAAMKLMTADQVATVTRLYNAKQTGMDGNPTTLGKAYEKEFQLAKDLLSGCKSKVDCYLAKLAEPASHDQQTQFQGVKAAYMVGILGKPEVRQKLLDMMPQLTNPAVKYVAATVIDHHSPKGDPEIATKLQAMVDAAEWTGDPAQISAYAPFKLVIARLEARAQ